MRVRIPCPHAEEHAELVAPLATGERPSTSTSRVRSDMAANLGPRCTLVGSDADVTEERVGDAACRSTNLFDGGGLVTVIGPDNLQVKLASGETLTLVRSAPRN